jgi:dTDP-4-amino-4,6-dideoxygalactose transaminase
VDICPRTYNLDTRLLEGAVTKNTKAIMPIHLFGQCADMDAVSIIAEKHGLVVIEDAAQAIGAELKGRRAGSMGEYGCFSFFPSKNLGAAGDGGIVVTDDPERAERLAILRGHGARPKYYHSLIGGNFRLDALQAAVVLVKLKYLDDWSAARQANAETYRELFEEARLTEDDRVVLPYAVPDGRHIYNQFVIRVARRDELREHLKKNHVATEVYYPVALHQQECFAYLGHGEGDFPESERAARETLALPIYPELTDEQQRYVVGKIKEFVDGQE